MRSEPPRPSDYSASPGCDGDEARDRNRSRRASGVARHFQPLRHSHPIADQHLIEILGGLVPNARYESGARSITSTDYRNAWNSPIPALSRGWLMTTVTPPEGFDRLVDALRFMLQPFVAARDGKELVHTNVGLIAAGVGVPTELERFARDVLTSAVLVGPDRTVALLRAWAGGEPIRYIRYTVLSGFGIEGDRQFPVEEGVTIQPLPNRQNQLLALGAPEMWVGSPLSATPYPLGAPHIYGAPAMVVEMAGGPVFSTAGHIPFENKPVASGPFGLNDPSFQGLSLACDSPVSSSCAWSNIPIEVQSFVPWARFTANHIVLFGGGLPHVPQSPTLTDETLERAIELAHKIVEHGLGNNTRTALDRWTKSLQGQFADRFIDLRTALEALYVPDGGSGEISYRLRTRCARHMATSFDDRTALAREVKDFYNTASGFAHGGLVLRNDRPPQPKHQRQLERAREICRVALIKVLEENQGQDINVDLVTLA